MKVPLQSKCLNGGIWRIRQMHRDAETGHEISLCNGGTLEKVLAIGAMNGGFYLINSENFDTITAFKDHKSLAYGIDLECNKCLLNLEDESWDEKCWVASCSFYDHMLCLWCCDVADVIS